GAAVEGLEHVMEEDRVGLAGVRTPQDDEVRILNLLVRARAAAGPEYRRQTDDAGSMSGAVTGVDVVAADDLAGELLGQIVHLVGRLRAGKHAEGIGSMALDRRPETPGSAVERFLPARREELAPLADHRLRDSAVASRHSFSSVLTDMFII